MKKPSKQQRKYPNKKNIVIATFIKNHQIHNNAYITITKFVECKMKGIIHSQSIINVLYQQRKHHKKENVLKTTCIRKHQILNNVYIPIFILLMQKERDISRGMCKRLKVMNIEDVAFIYYHKNNY